MALEPTADNTGHAAETDAMEIGDLGGLFDENGVEAGGAMQWTKPEEDEWEAEASDFWAPEAAPADGPQHDTSQPATGARSCSGNCSYRRSSYRASKWERLVKGVLLIK